MREVKAVNGCTHLHFIVLCMNCRPTAEAAAFPTDWPPAVTGTTTTAERPTPEPELCGNWQGSCSESVGWMLSLVHPGSHLRSVCNEFSAEVLQHCPMRQKVGRQGGQMV